MPAQKTSSPSPSDQLESFIDKFDAPNQSLIRATRKALRKRFPTAHELVYDNYNFFVIGYSPTPDRGRRVGCKGADAREWSRELGDPIDLGETTSAAQRGKMKSNVKAIAAGLAVLASTAAAQAPATDTLIKYWINPVSTDSSIRRFDYPQYIVFERHVKSSAPLLVFLPGTDGRPINTTEFANAAARQGYRAIGLSYNDVPAVAQICPRDPDPRCSDKFRQKRIYGDDVTRLIDDRQEESIVNRLAKLIAKLQRDHPDGGWDDYLENGKPKWSRIAVSGLSQGAGMAAYIAQKNEVARVILFSSPWDNYGRDRALAPWVRSGSGATPSDRWYAAYHRSEPMAPVIARAYSSLKIPSDHVRVFTLEPAKANAKGEIPYHPSGVANAATPRRPDGTPAYSDDWKFLLGDVK